MERNSTNPNIQIFIRHTLILEISKYLKYQMNLIWKVHRHFNSMIRIFPDTIYEGAKKMEFIYKKLCIYSYMFKLQSPSKYSPFDAIHLLRHFFSTAQNSF